MSVLSSNLNLLLDIFSRVVSVIFIEHIVFCNSFIKIGYKVGRYLFIISFVSCGISKSAPIFSFDCMFASFIEENIKFVKLNTLLVLIFNLLISLYASLNFKVSYISIDSIISPEPIRFM